MSVRAMSWAWSTPTDTPSERLVLLALADHAGEDGECWPGSASLAAKTGLSEGSVRRYITRLDERGILEKVERRRRKDGTLGTWIYRLRLDVDFRADRPDPERTKAQRVTSGHQLPVVTSERTSAHQCAVDQRAPMRAHESSISEPSREPSPNTRASRSSQRPTEQAAEVSVREPDDFDAWWSQYPRKTAKANAQRAWRKMKPADRAAALEALGDHVRSWRLRGTATEYIPHPASWLNGRRWEDDLTPATVGLRPNPVIVGLQQRLIEAQAREAAQTIAPSELAFDHDHDDEWTDHD